jgi:hypothetical protein
MLIKTNDEMIKDLATKGFCIFGGHFGFGMSMYHMKKRMKEFEERIEKTF